ncbi:MAG TPA: 16S rRNA (guanine(966)-N(2))-methyltransferase RsmD [Pyrinomonadaceae bacterium]|nr:16S rRNA (guanine(966)-N(2))-methyltransferase RsmD [Pyrinomonadaceae bacterium]
MSWVQNGDFGPWTLDFGLILRIIAGKFRGRNLKSPPSLEVRPTSDRLRETLFNILAPRIEGTRFLDLCAGSGAVGIEALSRGAAHATFVDESREMCSLIKANLDLCRIERNASEVIQAKAHDYLRRFISKQPDSGKPWDIVFFDPPYATDYAPVLKLLAQQSVITDEGLLVVEHHKKTELADPLGSMIRTRVLKQGDSALSFYSRTSEETT